MRPPRNITARDLLRFTLAVCLFTGCQSFRATTQSSPFGHKIERDQIVFHSDLPLVGKDRLIQQLCEQRDQVATKLQLPTTEKPIHVYLFADDASYYDFLDLRFPGFPARRAIFVESEVELAIYAYLGEHIAEDLRHEVTHGYLHAALPNLPLWLDEGLAEYFEVGPGPKGLNKAHLEYLLSQPNNPISLARLEQLTSAAAMTQQDYAESWAWVHFLLESDVDKTHLLTDYLADLQQGTAARLNTQLQKRLAKPELALAEHLQSLR